MFPKVSAGPLSPSEKWAPAGPLTEGRETHRRHRRLVRRQRGARWEAHEEPYHAVEFTDFEPLTGFASATGLTALKAAMA